VRSLANSRPAINIEEDPRAHEEHLYHLKDALRDARTTVVWLEVGSPDVDGTIERLPHMTPGGRLVLAIAGESPEERRQLNNRAAGTGVIHKAASTTYVDVESRFRSEAKWRDYIEGLPSARADDLYIRFTIGDTRIDLRERQYAECPPWRLYASRVFRYGVLGEWSHVGIAHESLRMTQQGVIDAVELIASRRIGILDKLTWCRAGDRGESCGIRSGVPMPSRSATARSGIFAGRASSLWKRRPPKRCTIPC
jgi:hypothetical protein